MNKHVQQGFTKSESIKDMLIKSQSQIQSAIDYIDQQATRDEKIKQVLQHAVDRFVEITDKGVIPSPQEIRLVKKNPQIQEETIEEQATHDQDHHNGLPTREAFTKNPIPDAQGNSSVHPEVSKDKKDPRKKEINNLKMEIQNRLFELSTDPEELLRVTCLKTKCSMGHSFLTVSDLAQTDNLAWLREIADELGRM